MRRSRTLLLASLLMLPGALVAQQAMDGPPPDDFEDYRWQPGEGPMAPDEGEEMPPMRRRFQERLHGHGDDEGAKGRQEFRRRMRERFQQGGTFGGPGGGKFRKGKRGQFGKRGGFGGGGGKELLARVRELDPALAKDLEGLQDKVPPQDRKRLMHEIARNVKQFVKESMAGGVGGDRKKMRDTVQEIAVLELRTVVSALQARHGEADPGATKGKLKGQLETLFDRKVQLQEERMKVMQQKLADLEKLIAERRAHKAQIVDQRLGELMGTAKKFDW
jgi:hypothetical protein